MLSTYSAFVGPHVHAPGYGEVVISNLLCVVETVSGRLVKVVPVDENAPSYTETLQAYKVSEADVHVAKAGQIFMAGLVDCHTHAPQYKYAGAKTDLPLMKWLHQVTFPAEASMSKPEVAMDVYTKYVRRLLKNGTTTALVFGTIDPEPCQLLAKICQTKRMRAIVGKVCMDRNSPDNYIESTEDGISRTKAFLDHVQSLDCPHLKAAVTPRFVPTCTPEMLKGLTQLTLERDCHFQSHMAETEDEVEAVASCHPEEARDVALFGNHGALRKKTVMAHCIHCNDAELRTLAATGTGIAHCPLANIIVNGDGILRVQRAIELGVRVGLGTDVAGGYSPSILHAARTAILMSRLLNNMMPGLHKTYLSLNQCLNSSQDATVKKDADGPTFTIQAPANFSEDRNYTLTWRHGFYLATVGGAKCLGMEDDLGTFEEGKFYDACLVDFSTEAFDIFEGDDTVFNFERFLLLGDDRNIVQSYVGGVATSPDARV